MLMCRIGARIFLGGVSVLVLRFVQRYPIKRRKLSSQSTIAAISLPLAPSLVALRPTLALPSGVLAPVLVARSHMRWRLFTADMFAAILARPSSDSGIVADLSTDRVFAHGVNCAQGLDQDPLGL